MKDSNPHPQIERESARRKAGAFLAAVRRPGGACSRRGAVQRGRTPHFLFGLAEKKTGRARSKRKDRLDALRRVRASALYGGRREMVPACLRGLADGRGVVQYRFNG